MGLIVQKYGGTSVGSVDRIKAVAERVARRARKAATSIVVVVSAMAGETNRLFKLAEQLSEAPNAARDRRAGGDWRAGLGGAARDPPHMRWAFQQCRSSPIS